METEWIIIELSFPLEVAKCQNEVYSVRVNLRNEENHFFRTSTLSYKENTGVRKQEMLIIVA